MPEDKPYIQRIFNFMTSAYGRSGKLAKDAFTNDFDTFYQKITTNGKYADKIYNALNDAYGQKGKVKAGSFTSNTDTFKSKVLAPVAQSQPQQFDVAAQMMDFSKVGQLQPSTPDPNTALAETAIDIPKTLHKGADGKFSETKQPGLMQDISAFDQLIDKKQHEEQQAVADFTSKALDTDPGVDLMTGQKLPMSDYQARMQEYKDRVEVFDKSLREQQQKADEFAQTTAGGLYYSFIRPVYQTFLNVGKNVTAGTARLAGGIGGSLGMEESERILNKTADGLVDYFDFNRLAREGNPTGFLNMTPTYQQGKLSRANIIPKAVEAISSMATLMGGARVLGGNSTALFTSSFMSTYEDYRKTAKNAGLTDNEADQFAITSAGVTSALEMISPNRVLLRPGELSSATKGVFRAIKEGVPVKQAVKGAFKGAIKEIGKENIQELSQSVGDHVVRGATDLASGENRFNESGAFPSFDEALETVVLTTIATGAISGRRFSRNLSPSNVERSAWAQAAERPEIIERGIENGLANNSITEEQAGKIRQDVSEYTQIYDALKNQLAETNPSADVSRIALDAFKSKKIKEQSQPIQGIPALSAVQEQTNQQNKELENNIKDELIGVPEEGTEVPAVEIKQLMDNTGASEKTNLISENGYKTNNINLNELYKTNEQFKNYIDKNQLKESKNEEGLRSPVIINSDGTIVDGLNRLAQQYVNGQESARAFIEMSQQQEESPLIYDENKGAVSVEEVNNEAENSGVIAPVVEPALDNSPVERNIKEAKVRRQKAIDRLKDSWAEFNTRIKESPYQRQSLFNAPDPIKDKKFYAALANYVKEELIYRVNQVRGFANKTKAQMKSELMKELKKQNIEGINKEELDAAFENAYNDASNIPGLISGKNDRVSFAKYIRDRIQVRETGRKTGTKEARERVSAVKKEVINALKKSGVIISTAELRSISGIFESSIKEGDTDEAISKALDKVESVISRSEKRMDQETTKQLNEEIRNIKKATREGIEAGREQGAAQGRKAGISEAAQRISAVRNAIIDLAKKSGIKISIPQLRTISSLLQRAATAKDIDLAVEDAVQKASAIIWQQKNAGKIAEVNKLIKSLTKMKRAKGMVLQDVEWIKQLALPNPSQVEDIDAYAEYLENFVNTRKANKLVNDKTRQEFQEFVDKENNRIYAEKRVAWQAELDQLIADNVLPADVTLDEYLQLLDGQKIERIPEQKIKKEDALKDTLKTRLSALKANVFEFKEPVAQMDERSKSIIDKLGEVDVSQMNREDLILLNNILNNIAEYGTVDGAGLLISNYEAKKQMSELSSSGAKIRQLPSQKVINKKNISNIMSALFYNDKAISQFRERTLGGIENKVSHVKARAQRVVKEFVELNKRYKIGVKENSRLFAASYLNQYRGVDNAQMSESLKQKLSEMIDDINYLYSEGQRVKGKAGRPIREDANNRMQALTSLGLADFTPNGKDLLVEVKEHFDQDNVENRMEEIMSSLSEGERAVYDFVREKYEEQSDPLDFMMRTYLNKEFKKERNYVSLVPRPKAGEQAGNPEISEETDITQSQKRINTKPSSTTITRADKKSDKIYYDGDFFSNFVNRYYTSLYTANALPELQRTAKLVNSEEFRKFITGRLDEGFEGIGEANAGKFKTKLADVINEEKYSPFMKRGKSSVVDHMMSRGVRLVLGNVWQGPKQYAPALIHNLAINNRNALVYALRSKGRAITDKAYGETRKKFLENFTGVQRSSLGSEAYDKYVKSVNEDPAWWMKPGELLDNIQKISSFVLERADKAAQNDAYISSYITSLIRQGVINNAGDFDMAEHAENPNKEALAYAEQMASNINNESAKAYRPDALTKGDYTKYLWLLQGFSLNAYQNAMNKAKIVFDNRATGEEKKEALSHFLGYLGEMGSYQLVGKWARNSQLAIAAALLSGIWGIKADEDEEKNKNKKVKENIRTTANIAADLTLSGLPAPVQAAMKASVNYGYKQWAKIEVSQRKKAAKGTGQKFNPKGTYLSPYYVPFYGVDGPGGAADFYLGVGKGAIDFVSETVEKMEKEDKEDKEDSANKNLATNLNRYLKIPGLVLGSGDLYILNARMQQVIKDAGEEKSTRKAVSAGRGRRRAQSRSRQRNPSR
jgi:hypothetical protein